MSEVRFGGRPRAVVMAENWVKPEELLRTAMPSEAQIAANRRNSAKSTGPTSARGKRHSRMNAAKHGLYANPEHLPAEDEAAHAWLIAQLEECWQPEGPMESVLVGQIAALQFELMRVMRGYDLHRSDAVNRAAISRAHKEDFRFIREADGEPIEGARRADQDIAEVYAREQCQPETQDLEHALKEAVTSPREMDITDFVDRRKGRLVRDLNQTLSTLKQLQAMRQSLAHPMPKQAGKAPEERISRVENRPPRWITAPPIGNRAWSYSARRDGKPTHRRSRPMSACSNERNPHGCANSTSTIRSDSNPSLHMQVRRKQFRKGKEESKPDMNNVSNVC